MWRVGVWAAASAAIAAAAGPLAPLDAAPPPPWLRVDTPNFTIVGAAPERDLQAVAAEFERFRAALIHLLNTTTADTVVPTIVIVFDSERAFEPFKPAYRGKPVEVDGMFVASADVNYIALVRKGDVRPIQHELAHLVINNVMPDLPPWLSEGLAEYYSTFELDDERDAIVGRAIDPHVQKLRTTKLLTLEELLSVQHDSPLYHQGARRTVFYAQSWALVHYLLRGRPSREEMLLRYAKAIEGGTPARKAWDDVFAREGIETRLREYILRGQFSGVRRTLPEPVQAPPAVAHPVSEADVDAFLGDLLAREDRSDQAVARLEAAAKRPDGMRARAALARLRVQQNALVDARALLSTIPPAPPDWLEAYAIGVAAGLAFEHERSSPETAAESVFGRTALARALAARPNVAHGWYVLAGLALLSDAELDAAEAAILRARALAPLRLQYIARHADVFLRRREYARARQILEPLLGDPRAAFLRSALESRMRFLESAERAAAAMPDVEPPRDGTDRIYTLELRRLQPGEARAAGMLTRVECAADALTLHVRIKGRTSRFRASRFQDVEFVTYHDDLTGPVGCGARRPEDLVYVTWAARPDAPGTPPEGATVVAVEFLPKDFRLKP